MEKALCGFTLVSYRGDDFDVEFGEFSATTIVIRPVSDAGRAFLRQRFGDAVVSIEIPRSRYDAFVVSAVEAGLWG